MEVEKADRQPYLTKKAVATMDDLMKGKIEYYIESPCRFDQECRRYCPPTALVFRPTFTKVDRPHAWKQCDLRIQSTLPLLGNNVTVDSVRGLTDETISSIGLNAGVDDTSDGETAVLELNPSTCLVRISLQVQDNRMIPPLRH
jgi:hypothetical protein